MNDTKTIKIKELITSNIPFLSLLIVIIFIIYVNVLSGTFLLADDYSAFVLNPITPGQAIKNFQLNQLYVSTVFIFGKTPFVYHFMSVVSHILNTILVFLLTYLLFGKKVSSVSTLLFAVHPLNSEAVNWISANTYLHNALFTLLNLVFFVLYRTKQEVKFLYFAIGGYLLQTLLIKKSWEMSTFFLIFIIDFFIFNKASIKKALQKDRLITYAPFILIFLCITTVSMVTAYKGRVYHLSSEYYYSPTDTTPYLNRLPYTLFMTFKLYLIPFALSLFHEGEVINLQKFLLMIFVCILLIAYAVYLFVKKSFKNLGLFLCIFASAMPLFAPVLGIWFIAERYLYLGNVFFCTLIAHYLLKIPEKSLKIVFVTILVLFSAKTFARTFDWKSDKTLWLSILKTNPNSYRVHNNLGDMYGKEGNIEKAAQSFKRSFELNPDYADPMHNLGNLYLQVGNMMEAKKYLEMSLEKNPRLYQSLDKLGYILYLEKDYIKAKEYFEKSLQINPNGEIAKRFLSQPEITK